MATIHQQIKKLENEAGLVEIIRDRGKSEGGRLTDFGQDFVYMCVTHGIPNGDIAKILDVTTSAISQQAAKHKTGGQS